MVYIYYVCIRLIKTRKMRVHEKIEDYGMTLRLNRQPEI